MPPSSHVIERRVRARQRMSLRTRPSSSPRAPARCTIVQNSNGSSHGMAASVAAQRCDSISRGEAQPVMANTDIDRRIGEPTGAIKYAVGADIKYALSTPFHSIKRDRRRETTGPKNTRSLAAGFGVATTREHKRPRPCPVGTGPGRLAGCVDTFERPECPRKQRRYGRSP